MGLLCLLIFFKWDIIFVISDSVVGLKYIVMSAL